MYVCVSQVLTLTSWSLFLSCSNFTNRSIASVRSDPSCSVLAVMAIDFTTASFWILLRDTVPLCADARHKSVIVILCTRAVYVNCNWYYLWFQNTWILEKRLEKMVLEPVLSILCYQLTWLMLSIAPMVPMLSAGVPNYCGWLTTRFSLLWYFVYCIVSLLAAVPEYWSKFLQADPSSGESGTCHNSVQGEQIMT